MREIWYGKDILLGDQLNSEQFSKSTELTSVTYHKNFFLCFRIKDRIGSWQYLCSIPGVPNRCFKILF